MPTIKTANTAPQNKPYPHNCTHEIYSQYIGNQVVNVHNPQYGVGTITRVEHGCNGLIQVQWANPWPRWYSPSDLALFALYPQKRWTHEG